MERGEEHTSLKRMVYFHNKKQQVLQFNYKLVSEPRVSLRPCTGAVCKEIDSKQKNCKKKELHFGIGQSARESTFITIVTF